MSRLEQLKAEIESLKDDEIAELFRWLSELDWARWDAEIEADSRAGKLNFLSEEARREKELGKLRDL